MRPLALIAVLVLASCIDEGAPRLPPIDRVYFPTGIAFLPAPDGGTLAVASSNFDNRYSFGSVTAIDLAALALPAFGAAVPAEGPPQIDLRTTDGDRVFIDAFASGQVGVYPLPTGGTRLFLPTRAATNALFPVDVGTSAGRISCVRKSGEATPQLANDCTVGSLSLSAVEAKGLGKPRAIEPVGVVADPATGDVYVTHRVAATDPLGTSSNPESYLVQMQAGNPFVLDYWSIGIAGANAVTLTPRFALLAGFAQSPLLRWVDRLSPARVGNALIEGEYAIGQARDLAVSTDRTELYLVGRVPPTLLVAQVAGLSTPAPTFRVVRGILLPADPNHLVVLPRAGKGDVVAITCSEEGAVLLYDADVGDMVGQVAVGTRPFGIARELRGAGARLYVTDFTDGQIAVLDIPDLAVPEDVRLVAKLGKSQQCILTGTPCD